VINFKKRNLLEKYLVLQRVKGKPEELRFESRKLSRKHRHQEQNNKINNKKLNQSDCTENFIQYEPVGSTIKKHKISLSEW
jgi:hypothetical protein